MSSESILAQEKKKDCLKEIPKENFSWEDNPGIQNLLDVISSILADEYIETVMKNPDVFTVKGIDEN
ncbi:MAG: hypothetical protein KAQ99_06535 [Candidatus Aureabacteria bacterium]|nr:hypothetical protein [Candidatus Auribacterota bacterium]MCK5161216.1 hypothetical protein [Candidatus Auribacterota bacterium]MCK5269096.1 hypothetical protein [Spirochaetota bacterium]